MADFNLVTQQNMEQHLTFQLSLKAAMNRGLQFQKCSQLFRPHETLSAAMRINNPNRSPLRLNG